MDCVVEMPRVNGIVSPSERLTLEGIEESAGPPERMGEILAPRFTVPENPPVLAMLMADEPLIPGLTHRVGGFAVIVRSGFCAAARAVESTIEVRMIAERPTVLVSFCFEVVPKVPSVFISMCF